MKHVDMLIEPPVITPCIMEKNTYSMWISEKGQLYIANKTSIIVYMYTLHNGDVPYFRLSRGAGSTSLPLSCTPT